MGKLLARVFLALRGWRAEGRAPEVDKFVLIAAPHTSNWDLAYLLALAQVFGVRVSWMGKHTLFRWPMGWIMTRLGGIPVRRHQRENVVKQMAEAFRASRALALTVPPEGTRGYRDHWKSGFYHIAREAHVPIVMGYLDYARKRGGFGPHLFPTGNVQRDMDEIRRFYTDKTGKYPQCFSRVRLAEEG
jgi:1-acyl-sn-glycerol-3-phosphate acyltransferase